VLLLLLLEQVQLPLTCVEDLLHIIHEAHVEHLIALVKHPASSTRAAAARRCETAASTIPHTS
jgi:hypothetical protein